MRDCGVPLPLDLISLIPIPGVRTFSGRRWGRAMARSEKQSVMGNGHQQFVYCNEWNLYISTKNPIYPVHGSWRCPPAAAPWPGSPAAGTSAQSNEHVVIYGIVEHVVHLTCLQGSGMQVQVHAVLSFRWLCYDAGLYRPKHGFVLQLLLPCEAAKTQTRQPRQISGHAMRRLCAKSTDFIDIFVQVGNKTGFGRCCGASALQSEGRDTSRAGAINRPSIGGA